MDHFTAPTSIINIQESDMLKTNDRFHETCEVNKSNEKFKTQDTTTIQNIDFLFSQFQQPNINIEPLVMSIYSLSLQIEYKASLNKYFSDNFPFIPFFKIIELSTSPECRSYAFLCLASACQSKLFPYQYFENANNLGNLCQVLCTEVDPNIIDSTLQLLSAVSKNSEFARNYLLQTNIISQLRSMKLKYPVAELLESICSLFPPPPAQFIPGIAQFIAILIDGSESSIFELGLSSLLSLLTNHAEGIIADQFQHFLPPIFYSESNFLIPLALKILMFVQNPHPSFCEILLKILGDQEFSNLCNNPMVLLLVAQLFAHFQPIWRPIILDRPFVLLESKIGTSRFNVDIQIIQTMILYYDRSHVDDLVFFNILLRFSESNEISCQCMNQILLMIQSQPSPPVYQQMLNQLEQSTQTFIGLANGEDEDMAERAESILNEIEKANANM